MDAADNDPYVMLSALAVIAERVGAIDATDAARLTASSSWSTEILPLLAEAIAACPTPFVFVLDDVHVLDGPSRDQVLPTIVANVPRGSVCVLASRTEPPIPSSRLRLTGHARAVDATDLTLTLDEASTLLANSDVIVDERVARELVERTEGWAAALCIAALALRDADDVDAAVARFTGGDRFVADFLTEEVMSAMPPGDVDFLLATSVLDRLCGRLCDAVLQRVDSGGTLERLARSNRFVVPLDGHGEWYRYHRLFAEMLRSELERRDAASADRVVLEASRWFIAHGELDAAVEHALCASDRRDAVALIWRLAQPMLVTGRSATVERWLDHFTVEERQASPALSLTAAWLGFTTGDFAAMRRATTVVEQVPGDTLLPDGTRLAAATALLRAVADAGPIDDLRHNASVAFEGHHPGSQYRAVARYLEGCAHMLAGDDSSARAVLRDAAALGAAGSPSVEAHALGQLARLAAADGDWAEATQLVDRALGQVAAHRLEERPVMVVTYAVAALVHGTGGAPERAVRERNHGVDLLERVDRVGPHLMLQAVLDLTAVSIQCGDVAMARALFDDARRRLTRLSDPGILAARCAEVGDLLAARAARPGVELVVQLTAAELRVLDMLPTHYSFSDIGKALFISRNTVKSHAAAIYRKLGVASRGQAVEAARRLGLLPG